MFLQSGSQNGSMWALLCELETNWLCEPENNLRTRYIESRPNQSLLPGRVCFSTVKACRLENMASTSLSA